MAISTRRNSVRRYAPFIVLWLALAIAGGLPVACTSSGDASAGVGDSQLPPGLVKGTQFILVFRAAGAHHDTFEVQEVLGVWLRAKAVETASWREGAEVWINLAAVDQLWVGAPPTAEM